MAIKSTTMSREGFHKIQEELEYLVTIRRKEIAEKLKEARSYGDLSENAEYDEAKNEQGKLYSRIAEIENILANCSVIEEEADSDPDTVRLGSKITVMDTMLDEEETYQVVGSQEADPMNGRISEESPFGKALLGKHVGDTVIVDAPAGNIEYKVVSIQR